MSAFTPYQIWKAAYPELKAGEVIRIQSTYYMVIQVRHNRKAVAVTGTQTNYILALDNNNTAGTSSTFLESMTGNLSKNRIVHIEYVALTVADTPEFIWGTQPLQSKDVADTLNANLAGATNPIEVDRWSYDQSMRLLVTQGNVSQVYYFDIVEYEIVAYAGTPTQPYWQLLSNGAGIYVVNEDIAKNIAASNLAGTSKPIPKQ
jgi:hypothetical protein